MQGRVVYIMTYEKYFFLTILIISLLFFSGSLFAHSGDSHQSEIGEGKSLVKSRASCDELTDEQLEAIGEYLMEKMHPGESHEAMHKMMGLEEGAESHKQFHVNLAKMIYCGKEGTMPMVGMMPMMPMMGGSDSDFGMANMMNWSNWVFGAGWAWLGWIFMILFWALVIVAIVALIIWLINQIRGEVKGKSALDILKERYAKGEISKGEFEEKKKDLI